MAKFADSDCTEAEREFQTQTFNRQLAGVAAEIWTHSELV
jgi:hypothetical protein